MNQIIDLPSSVSCHAGDSFNRLSPDPRSWSLGGGYPIENRIMKSRNLPSSFSHIDIFLSEPHLRETLDGVQCSGVRRRCRVVSFFFFSGVNFLTILVGLPTSVIEKMEALFIHRVSLVLFMID